MRILALQLKRLGDVVLTTPALELLRKQGEVTLAVMGSAVELLPAIPGLAGGIVFGRGRGWTPWQQVIWGGFDKVVDFTGSDRSAVLALLSRAGRRVTFRREKSPWLRRWPYDELIDSPVRDQHTVDHYARLVSREEPVPAPSLQVPKESLRQAQALRGGSGASGEYALIHAGTARAEKYWLPERWAELIDHCQERHGLTCVLTGGADAEEIQHLREIERLAKSRPPNLAGKLDLLSLAAMVSEARLVLSVDTVTAHLAAAFQRPQVVLFGPTNPFHWRPRHGAAAVFSAAQPEAPMQEFTPRMKGAPMELLSTGPVIRATDALLSP